MRVINEIYSMHAEEQMKLTCEMGIHSIGVTFGYGDDNADGVAKITKMAKNYNLKIVEAGSSRLQKCPSIIWGMADRDVWIKEYNEFTRILSYHEIPVNYVAWQPAGILRSRIDTGVFSHGAATWICDIDELNAQGSRNPERITIEQLWNNFEYFISKTLPVCEQKNVRLALHPNDPPVPVVCEIPSLIWNTQGFRKAFKLAGDSPFLGMKLCVGCWLEQPEFGDLPADILEFSQRNKIITIHFRNVSSQLPRFEETMAEDGYANMMQIMQEFINCGCTANLSIDHALFHPETKCMSATSRAYMTGYMKGLMHSAEFYKNSN